jgi:hypothetical protein
LCKWYSTADRDSNEYRPHKETNEKVQTFHLQ